jgi:hypothetical protein
MHNDVKPPTHGPVHPKKASRRAREEGRSGGLAAVSDALRIHDRPIVYGGSGVDREMN